MHAVVAKRRQTEYSAFDWLDQVGRGPGRTVGDPFWCRVKMSPWPARKASVRASAPRRARNDGPGMVVYWGTTALTENR